MNDVSLGRVPAPPDRPERELPATVYTPGSPVRHPGKLLRAMFRDLGASRELAWRLFLRDVKAQYRNSILGYVWVFVPPLVASLPFIYLNSTGIVRMGDTPIPYGAYAMIGTIIWQTFVDALNSPLSALAQARAMMTRINFPREAILLAGLLHVGFSFMVRLALLIAVLAWYRIVPPSTVALFPAGMLALVLFGFTLGLALVPVGLLFGDIGRAIPVAMSFVMLLTPVLYPVPASGAAGFVAGVNPLTPLVVTTRDWLTTGAASNLGPFIVVSALSAVLLFLGWAAYRVAMPHLIARMGN